MSYGNGNPLAGTLPTGGELGSEIEYAERRGRRQAISQAFRPTRIRHALMHAPMIHHPKSGRAAIPHFPSSPGGSKFTPGGF